MRPHSTMGWNSSWKRIDNQHISKSFAKFWTLWAKCGFFVWQHKNNMPWFFKQIKLNMHCYWFHVLQKKYRISANSFLPWTVAPWASKKNGCHDNYSWKYGKYVVFVFCIIIIEGFCNGFNMFNMPNLLLLIFLSDYC